MWGCVLSGWLPSLASAAERFSSVLITTSSTTAVLTPDHFLCMHKYKISSENQFGSGDSSCACISGKTSCAQTASSNHGLDFVCQVSDLLGFGDLGKVSVSLSMILQRKRSEEGTPPDVQSHSDACSLVLFKECAPVVTMCSMFDKMVEGLLLPCHSVSYG